MTPTRIRPQARTWWPADQQVSIDDLLYAISTRGFAANEHHVEHFARRLMSAGQAPNLTAIMLDRGAAPVVRERAFARAVAALRATPRQFAHVA